jgi:hypothetical protein
MSVQEIRNYGIIVNEATKEIDRLRRLNEVLVTALKIARNKPMGLSINDLTAIERAIQAAQEPLPQ